MIAALGIQAIGLFFVGTGLGMFVGIFVGVWLREQDERERQERIRRLRREEQR